MNYNSKNIVLSTKNLKANSKISFEITEDFVIF